MKTGRRPRDIHINIPEDVLAGVQRELFDPLTKKPVYGGLSSLVTGLLRRWLSDQSIYPLVIKDHSND